MGPDSPLSARMEAHLGSAGVPSVRVDRPQFFADVQALELRLAIIDDRFERLAARPDEAYRAFRRDTITRVRSLATRAGVLEAAGALDANRRRHVAAVLTMLTRRVAQLDEQRARNLARRGRTRDGPRNAGRGGAPRPSRAVDPGAHASTPCVAGSPPSPTG